MSDDTSTWPRLVPGDADFGRVYTFLIDEAEILERGQYMDWFGLLDDEVTYRMPVSATVLRGAEPVGVEPTYHINENRRTLELRVHRLTKSPSVWAENPMSRTRRLVTNIRVRRGDGEFAVTSSLVLMRFHHDEPDYDLVTGERHDVLRVVGDELKLRRREIVIDQTRLLAMSLPELI